MLIAMQAEHHPELDRRLSEVNSELVPVRTAPHYRYAVIRGGVDTSTIVDLPYVYLSESPAVGWRGVLKRATDLAIAIPLLLVLAPLMACLALAIRLTSKGPALFFQRRIGREGETFWLIKFRTMTDDAEKGTGPVWAENNDPRCTWLGSWLRKVSLDELPQLWNVIRGDMSLVGPRPERPVFVEKFGGHMPKYMLRHTVNVGMTGWAQVRGWRGNSSLQKRLEHDLYYIENWSLWFDLKVLWMTLRGGFLNRNP